jgi:adenosine deaminase
VIDPPLSGPALRRFCAALPKAELHVHLEGSMEPATLLRLARRRGVELPARDEAGLRDWFRFRDFEHFVEIYLTCSRCLRDPEDFQVVARDHLAVQAHQGVLVSEVHFTVATHIWAGRNGGEIMDALAEVAAESESRYGVRLRFILDMIRNFPERADATLDLALSHRGRTVVAVGLTGMEGQFPDTPFREHFTEAARQGLHRVAHAGEHSGPATVRSALEGCGAERIGHGVRAIEDPALVAELVARRVPLEICPSSNVCLGVFPALAAHSFAPLAAAGVEVTVNSDDPPMFGTTLAEEYARLAETFGYERSDLERFARASLRHAFVPAADRPAFEAEFERRLAAARAGVAER